MKKGIDEFDFKDFLGIFAPKLWIIVIVSALVSLFCGVYSAFLKKDTYTSTSSLIMTKETSSIGVGDIETVYKMLDACIEVMDKEIFLEFVREGLEKNYPEFSGITTKEISRYTKVSKLNNTEVFEVSVTTLDQELSYAVATEFSRAIENRLADELLPYSSGTVKFRCVEEARRSLANNKHVFRNTLLGLVCGAAASMAIIYVLKIMDVVVHDKRKLEKHFNYPILGVIPFFENNKREGA